MRLIVDAQGSVHGLYDELIDLTRLGALTIRRASHVEPDAHGQWYADLAPVAGPTLGPFAKRSEALEAERRWLERAWLGSTPFADPADDRSYID